MRVEYLLTQIGIIVSGNYDPSLSCCVFPRVFVSTGLQGKHKWLLPDKR